MSAAGADDADACRELVDAFQPAIAGLARRFPAGIGVDRQELMQEGVTGLQAAARRYDGGLGTPFWAYASFWVRKAMQELVAQLTRPVTLSDRAVRGLARIRRARAEYLRAHGAEPTAAELSRATGLAPEQVERLLATERAPRGMDEPLRRDHGTTALVRDAIVDPLAEREYDLVLDEIEIRHVHNLAAGLDERARAVIQAHFRTYFIDARGDEAMGSTWSYLDITALGPRRTGRTRPRATQTPLYGWWNLHDQYGEA